MLLADPVAASDGFMYEKASLEGILRTNPVSPMTREPLQTQFYPANGLKQKAFEFRETRSKELLAFAGEAIAAGQRQMAIEAAERAADYVNALESCPAIKSKLEETYSKLGRPVPGQEASAQGFSELMSSLARRFIP